MKKCIRLIALIAALHFAAPITFACSCAESKVKLTKKAFHKWFDTFDGAIFVGTAESVERVQIKLDDLNDATIGLTATVEKQKVVFRLKRFWKGVQSSTIIVYTGAG